MALWLWPGSYYYWDSLFEVAFLCRINFSRHFKFLVFCNCWCGLFSLSKVLEPYLFKCFFNQTAEALGVEVIITLESLSKDFVLDFMNCMDYLSDSSGKLSSFLGSGSSSSSKLTLFLSSCSQLILFCTLHHLKLLHLRILIQSMNPRPFEMVCENMPYVRSGDAWDGIVLNLMKAWHEAGRQAP